MELDVPESGEIRLKKVFNPITLETEEGEKIAIVMRDGGFELYVNDPSAKSENEGFCLWTIKNGQVTRPGSKS